MGQLLQGVRPDSLTVPGWHFCRTVNTIGTRTKKVPTALSPPLSPPPLLLPTSTIDIFKQAI